MSEKTEQPTNKRIRDARKKGQVAKSVEVVSGMQLAAIALIMFFFGEGWLEEIKVLLQTTLSLVTLPGDRRISDITLMWAWQIASMVGIIAVVVILATLLALLPQVGLVISTEVFANSGSKLNPVSNIKQIFSIRSLFELGKSLIKIGLLCGIFSYLLKDQFSSLQFLPACGVDCGLPIIAKLLTWLFVGLLIGYVVFALADYYFQKRTITKQLMMSKEEIKQEYKDSEGNPEIKQRRREIHREIQHSNVSEKVKKTSVVIRNPTHIAICLYFNLKETALPTVIAKAKGKEAEEIIKMAEKFGIPLVENVPLARQLMQKIEIDQPITAEFFEPVAEILRLIMDLSYEGSQSH